MQHDDRVYLEHMLDMVEEISKLIAGRTKAQFDCSALFATGQPKIRSLKRSCA